ncbi:MAG TPA: hypothetical protein DC047_09945 [Blastocatellia bacterium]|nr:hypothetical protein [Blastocatellia bacterium]
MFEAYSVGYDAGRGSCGYPCVASHQDVSHDVMRFKIEVALLVICLSLWSKKLLGFCISVVAATFIISQYGVWYLDTQRWLREMGVKSFSKLPVPGEWPHFAGFYRATPWDFFLLLFITALLIWQLRVLIALATGVRRSTRL